MDEQEQKKLKDIADAAFVAWGLGLLTTKDDHALPLSAEDKEVLEELVTALEAYWNEAESRSEPPAPL